jgi:hypothetical protein
VGFKSKHGGLEEPQIIALEYKSHCILGYFFKNTKLLFLWFDRYLPKKHPLFLPSLSPL